MNTNATTPCANCQRLQAQVAALQAQVDALLAEVAALREQLAVARKDSSTSSKPLLRHRQAQATHPRAGEQRLSCDRGAAAGWLIAPPESHSPLLKAHRCVGPPRAVNLGLRAHVDQPAARNDQAHWPWSPVLPRSRA